MLLRYTFTKFIFYKLQWLIYRLDTHIWVSLQKWHYGILANKQIMYLKWATFSGHHYKQGHAIHRSRMNENIVL